MLIFLSTRGGKVHIVSIKERLNKGFDKYEDTINKLSTKERKKYGADIELGENESETAGWTWLGKEDKKEDGISRKKAGEIIDRTQQDMQSQYEILSSDLSNLFEKELKDQAQSYLDEYQRYISGLIKTEDFTLNTTLNLIRIVIPDNTNALLEKFSGTKTVTKKVHRTGGNPDKRWYKPWTWFDDHYHEWDENVESTKKIIKMKELFETSIEPQFQQFFSMIEDAQSIAESNAQNLKNFFTKEVERLDNALKEAVQTEEESVKSQESIERQIEENKSKAEWLNCFIRELNTVLEV
jgi:hypothetical protein